MQWFQKMPKSKRDDPTKQSSATPKGFRRRLASFQRKMTPLDIDIDDADDFIEKLISPTKITKKSK